MTVELESSLTSKSQESQNSQIEVGRWGVDITLYIQSEEPGSSGLAAPLSKWVSALFPYLTEVSCVIALNRYWRNRVLIGERYAREAQRSMHLRDCPKFLQKKPKLCDSKLD